MRSSKKMTKRFRNVKKKAKEENIKGEMILQNRIPKLMKTRK